MVALFKVCRQDSFRCLYPQALRTLASICCVEEGVHQLEKVRGQPAGRGLRSLSQVGRCGERPLGGHLGLFVDPVPETLLSCGIIEMGLLGS